MVLKLELTIDEHKTKKLMAATALLVSPSHSFPSGHNTSYALNLTTYRNPVIFSHPQQAATV